MSLIPSGFAKSAAAAGFYDHPIEQSLRLNDDDSAYLSWTPASAGNRKTWTFSAWVKLGNVGIANRRLFTCFNGTDDTTWTEIRVGVGSAGYYDSFAFGGYATNWIITNAQYRDPSAWYHLVVVWDSSNATAADRARMYVNGERITSFYANNNPDLDENSGINQASAHKLGGDTNFTDGYLAEVHFIDGTALDASSFGETKSGVWIPKAYSGSYGTNGFYLPFNHDYSVEGFSATTYTGNGGTQYIGGVGFEPDLVWIKNRDSAGENHSLYDSVRPEGYTLYPNLTEAENTGVLLNLENDGFSLTTGNNNASGSHYVAWCWDAGSGSPVSNTDGSITSSVKASTTYGFSIVSYTGNGTSGATIGHGLSTTPELAIFKMRTGGTASWAVYHKDVGTDATLQLNTTSASISVSGKYSGTNSSVMGVNNASDVNFSGSTYIAYCFHSVSGYSKFGSYTAASGDDVVTCGFKPAFVMVKRTDSTGNWEMHDGVRYPTIYQDNGESQRLRANDSSAEAQFTNSPIVFTDTGFYLDSSVSGDSYADYDANGGTYIYMAFADKREAAFWLDQSGNNNDFENNNLTESDISLDSPTNNFATLNVLRNGGSASPNGTLLEGNLKLSAPNNTYWYNSDSTIYASSGKWYAEVLLASGTTTNVMLGIKQNSGSPVVYFPGSDTSSYGYVSNTGNKYYNNTGAGVAYGSTFTNGDIIGIALDLDAGTLTYYKNGVSQGTAFTGIASGDWAFAIASGNVSTLVSNFGQDSSFAGNKTAQGNTDDNGYGDFYYAPPSGYLALCTANLEVPDAMNPALDNSPQDYFNTVLYTGNGSTQSITGVGFQPDFTWIKQRNTARDNVLFDVIRGATEQLFSNATTAETTNSGTLTSFNTDGFSVGGSSNANQSSGTYAAWNWKANGSGVSNTDGSITSTVSANTDAGFSIVSWTGDGTSSNVGHGLNEAPQVVIIKDRDSANNWYFAHTLVDGTNDIMYLNLTDANGTLSGSVPTSSVFYVEGGRNASGNDQIAYCFHSVEGFSKAFSYSGNGSTDGVFVYCGFKPAFLIYKRTDSADAWVLVDNKRNTYNPEYTELYPNLSNAEANDNRYIDFVANGYKIRGSSTTVNASGGTYIGIAFAESPFKYSTAR